MPVAEPDLLLAQAAAHAMVMVRQIVEPCIELVQPLQGDRTPASPAVSLRRLLDDRNFVVTEVDQPGKALCFSGSFLGGALRLLRLDKRRQRIEGALPRLHKGDDLREGDDGVASERLGALPPGCSIAGGPA